jgi:hypothetical protein
LRKNNTGSATSKKIEADGIKFEIPDREVKRITLEFRYIHAPIW